MQTLVHPDRMSAHACTKSYSAHCWLWLGNPIINYYFMSHYTDIDGHHHYHAQLYLPKMQVI